MQEKRERKRRAHTVNKGIKKGVKRGQKMRVKVKKGIKKGVKRGQKMRVKVHKDVNQYSMFQFPQSRYLDDKYDICLPRFALEYINGNIPSSASLPGIEFIVSTVLFIVLMLYHTDR